MCTLYLCKFNTRENASCISSTCCIDLENNIVQHTGSNVGRLYILDIPTELCHKLDKFHPERNTDPHS